MQKHKKIIILVAIIIAILSITIYDIIYYSQKEILEIINRNNEQFSNVYIKIENIKEMGDTFVNEIYSKDNIIYSTTYELYEDDDTSKIATEILNLNTKKRLDISHSNKKIYTSKIRGKRIS